MMYVSSQTRCWAARMSSSIAANSGGDSTKRVRSWPATSTRTGTAKLSGGTEFMSVRGEHPHAEEESAGDGPPAGNMDRYCIIPPMCGWHTHETSPEAHSV